jgi:hypothetical protein
VQPHLQSPQRVVEALLPHLAVPDLPDLLGVSVSPSRSRNRATTVMLHPNANCPSRNTLRRFARRFCSAILVMVGI